MRNQKVALVTGASSGFGELTARLLAQSGFKVFGTSRRSGAIGGGVEMIELDVTLQASVEACIQTVRRSTRLMSWSTTPARRTRVWSKIPR